MKKNMKTKDKPKIKIVTVNRKARYDYDIIDTWEAGLKLQGLEVKALRDNLVSISESWVNVEKGKALLIGASINPKSIHKWQEYNPTRKRILLLHKREIIKLEQISQKGLTIVPLKIYFNERGLAKLQIATARGRKKHDKRRAMQERDQKRYGY